MRKIFNGGEKYQRNILRIKEYGFPNYGGHQVPNTMNKNKTTFIRRFYNSWDNGKT